MVLTSHVIARANGDSMSATVDSDHPIPSRGVAPSKGVAPLVTPLMSVDGRVGCATGERDAGIGGDSGGGGVCVRRAKGNGSELIGRGSAGGDASLCGGSHDCSPSKGISAPSLVLKRNNSQCWYCAARVSPVERRWVAHGVEQ